MALQLLYQDLESQYGSKKPGFKATGDVQGTAVINVPALKPIVIPLTDVTFESGTTVQTEDGLGSLGISNNGSANINASSQPSLIFNSDRVIINSKSDYTMLFGQRGVAISSPNKVNIDADDTITLFGENNLYLGIPNKGNGTPPDSKNPDPNLIKRDSSGNPTKASATKNFDYEPLVLGIKLANWLDDLVQVLKNSIILTPVGKGYFREDTQYDLVALQSRINEMLSTYAFIDGHSHELPESDTIPPPPPKVTQAPTNLTGEVAGEVFVDGVVQGQETTPAQTDLTQQPDYYTTRGASPSLDQLTKL